MSDRATAKASIFWPSGNNPVSAFHPTLLLCATVTDTSTAAARRFGAAGCLLKAQLSPAGIASAIRDTTKSAGGTDRIDASSVATNETTGERTQDPLKGAANTTVRISGYRMVREIGAGAMARVYQARRESDGQDVVIKLLDPRLHQDQAFRQRFTKDYAMLRRIAHNHVVAIFDQALNERYGYIIMEYFPAGNLLARIGEQGLSSDAALLFLAQIARGLDAVHGAGLVHRDLKPQNILFRNDLQLAIADCGLIHDAAGNAGVTQRSTPFAKPLYMSPEQCVGAPHDQRGDLYSLGILFFQMLTGRPPYIADDTADLAFQHVHGTLPRLPAKLAAFQPLLNRLLAKKPEHRPASAALLLAEIGQAK